MKRRPPLTDRELASLRLMASRGLTWPDIGRIIDRSTAWLQRNKTCLEHYRKGRAQAKLRIAETLFAMATSGRVPAATIFAAKVVCGFDEAGTAFRDDEQTQAKTVAIPGARFGEAASDAAQGPA